MSFQERLAFLLSMEGGKAVAKEADAAAFATERLALAQARASAQADKLEVALAKAALVSAKAAKDDAALAAAKTRLSAAQEKAGASTAKLSVATQSLRSAKAQHALEEEKAASAVKGSAASASLAGRAMDRLGLSARSTGSAVKALGGVLAARSLKNFAADTKDAASALQEQQTAAEVIFGGASAQVREFAKNAAEAYGLSERAALQYANTTAGLLLGANFPDEEAAQFSLVLERLAADVASLRDVQGGAAVVLEKFRSGLTGEIEPLRSIGIFLDEAKTKQEALRLGLYDGVGAMSDHAKVAGRLSIILKQTSDAQGDFARTSQNAANQERIAQANYENAKATLGDKLLPVWTGLIDTVNQYLTLGKEVNGQVNWGITHYDKNASALKKVGQAFWNLGTPMKRAKKDAEGYADAGEKLANSSARIVKTVDEVRRSFVDVQSAVSAAAEAERGVARASEDVADARRDLAEAERETEKRSRDLAGARVDVADAEREVAEAVEDLEEARRDQPRNLAKAELEYAAALRSVTTATTSVAEAVAKHGAKSDEAAEARLRLAEAQQRVGDADDERKRVASGEDEAAAVRNVEEAKRGHADAQEKLNDLLAADPTDAVREARQRLADQEWDLVDAVLKRADAQDKAKEAMKQGSVTAEQMRRQVEALNTELGQLGMRPEFLEQLRQLDELMIRLSREGEQMGPFGPTDPFARTTQSSTGELPYPMGPYPPGHPLGPPLPAPSPIPQTQVSGALGPGKTLYLTNHYYQVVPNAAEIAADMYWSLNRAGFYQ